ncbi:MAG: hypothetical protein KM310_07000 [Clostridiales bacterium]|nr:hypothetical protein [Clostridiales bacterium]
MAPKDPRPHPDSDSAWKYYDYGITDVWGRKVYVAFFFGKFAGLRYRRTDREMKQIKGNVQQLGVSRWADCPVDVLPPDLIRTFAAGMMGGEGESHPTERRQRNDFGSGRR